MKFEIYNERDGRELIRGVIFDMDGTILDTEKLYCGFAVKAANELGYPMTMAQALQFRSSSKSLGQQILKDLFGPEADYIAVRSLRVAMTEEFIAANGIEVKPGAGELLDALRERKILTAIATAAPMERAQRYLAQTGLLEKFDQIVCTGNVKNGKPAPDVYLYASERLGLAPGECIAVEDSPRGVESAFRAGCFSVMVPDLDQPSEETKQFIHAKLKNLGQILDLIQYMQEE
jgi:HAD superfamily hydrolase (TIGR01509 family)